MNRTIIKTKIKKSDDQTNIDKYRIAATITEYHVISKSIFLRIIIPNDGWTDPNYRRTSFLKILPNIVHCT